MKEVKVKSSSIKSLTYDENRKTLQVVFKNDKIYIYADVPLSAYENLMNADSIGSHFNKEIALEYNFIKVRAGKP